MTSTPANRENTAPPPPMMTHRQPPPRRGMGLCGVLFLVAAGLICLVLFGFFALGVVGEMLGGALAGAGAGRGAIGGAGDLPEVVLDGGRAGAPTIAVIPVRGAIMGDPSPHIGGGNAFEVGEMLRRAGDDARVKAVLLYMDTPGGGLTASDQLHEQVVRLKNEKNKKIVVWCADYNCSGGYYMSAPADYIVASPTALVGSIGVIVSRYDASELSRKLGVAAVPFKSGDAKDFGNLFEPVSPEERAYFEGLVGGFHQRFVDFVAEGRGLEPETVRSLADGRAYSAAEALELKLVDEVGYYPAALAKAHELAGLSGGRGARIVTYRRQPSLRDILFATGGEAPELGAWLREAAAEARTPRIQARMAP